jgi:filamentous hemagglutinin
VAGGGEPPINPGTALATSAGEQAANAALTSLRGAPSNAILSNGGGSTDDSNQGQASSQSASSSNPQGTNGAGSNSFPQATSADIDALRAKYSVPEGNTLAVARTDIPGMQGEVLEGLSPSIRSQAGLPSLDEVYGADRPIKSPYQNPLFTRHAEEDLFNGVAQQIDSSGLKGTDLAGKTLDVQISNMSGVCNKCTAGLAGSSDLSGVVQQFSNRYPDLTVRISAVGGNAMPGRTTIVVRGGKIVN